MFLFLILPTLFVSKCKDKADVALTHRDSTVGIRLPRHHNAARGRFLKSQQAGSSALPGSLCVCPCSCDYVTVTLTSGSHQGCVPAAAVEPPLKAALAQDPGASLPVSGPQSLSGGQPPAAPYTKAELPSAQVSAGSQRSLCWVCGAHSILCAPSCFGDFLEHQMKS